MGAISGFAVYFMVWWVVLFAVLPWGIQRHDGSIEGVDPGAPQIHGLKKKMLITSILSLLVWLVIYFLVETDYISFQTMAERIPLS